MSNSSSPGYCSPDGGYSSSISFILNLSLHTSLITSYLQLQTLMTSFSFLFFALLFLALVLWVKAPDAFVVPLMLRTRLLPVGLDILKSSSPPVFGYWFSNFTAAGCSGYWVRPEDFSIRCYELCLETRRRRFSEVFGTCNMEDGSCELFRLPLLSWIFRLRLISSWIMAAFLSMNRIELSTLVIRDR